MEGGNGEIEEIVEGLNSDLQNHFVISSSEGEGDGSEHDWHDDYDYVHESEAVQSRYIKRNCDDAINSAPPKLQSSEQYLRERREAISSDFNAAATKSAPDLTVGKRLSFEAMDTSTADFKNREGRSALQTTLSEWTESTVAASLRDPTQSLQLYRALFERIGVLKNEYVGLAKKMESEQSWVAKSKREIEVLNASVAIERDRATVLEEKVAKVTKMLCESDKKVDSQRSNYLALTVQFSEQEKALVGLTADNVRHKKCAQFYQDSAAKWAAHDLRTREELKHRHEQEIAILKSDLSAKESIICEEWEARLNQERETQTKILGSLQRKHVAEYNEWNDTVKDQFNQHQQEIATLKSDFFAKETIIREEWEARINQERETQAKTLESLQKKHLADYVEWNGTMKDRAEECSQLREKLKAMRRMAEGKFASRGSHQQ